jgi:acyl CoA:acetate/3-ketoacid CoA transferase beta subunit
MIVTDLAVIRRVEDSFVVEAVADGFSPDEVIALTEMDLKVALRVGRRDSAGDGTARERG